MAAEKEQAAFFVAMHMRKRFRGPFLRGKEEDYGRTYIYKIFGGTD